MLFMNEYEITLAVDRTAIHPIQNKAARFLASFTEQVNAHSDGWPYWSVAVRSASRLMTLVQSPNEITETQFNSALVPIKSFYTRRGYKAGMQYPSY
jgi:hypothetical protein